MQLQSVDYWRWWWNRLAWAALKWRFIQEHHLALQIRNRKCLVDDCLFFRRHLLSSLRTTNLWSGALLLAHFVGERLLMTRWVDHLSWTCVSILEKCRALRIVVLLIELWCHYQVISTAPSDHSTKQIRRRWLDNWMWLFLRHLLRHHF